MTKRTSIKRLCAAAGLLALLFALLLPPVVTQAAEAAIYDIDIVYDLQADGTAQVTEVWDVSVADGTEWYIPKYNMEERTVENLTVTDENGTVFTNIGRWNVDADIDEKAGKCGLVETQGGYELCWGVGSYGAHTYTITYTVKNAVMGYGEKDALYMTLVPKDLSSAPQHVKAVIKAEGVPFDTENTGIWVFGFLARFNVENNVVDIESDGALSRSDYVVALVEFEQGMFAPSVYHDKHFDDLLAEATEGSNYGSDGDYGYDGDSGYGGGLFGFLEDAIPFLVMIPMVGVFVALFAVMSASSKKGTIAGDNKSKYKDVPYSRNLPYKGSLPATYARLDQLSALDSEGTIIGAYLLRWIRSKQVQLVKQQAGLFGNKEEDAIQLFTARPEMPALERSLYDMLVAAAGSDFILQSKEFEKWSRKRFEKVEGWLERYKNQGASDMRALGTTTTVAEKVFFNLFTTHRTVLTPVGEQLTAEMFGFKKYLEEFTIINEREAKEVQLWDEYLVFAQVFGIADKVAAQFKELYPDYFVKMAAELGYGNVNWFDIYMINRIANNYGRAMATGYRAGVTAHNSVSSGGGTGGGSFHSGGGGGSSGGFSSGGGSR